MSPVKLPSVSNILAICSSDSSTEQCFPLLSTPTLRLEKIESHGCATPTGHWYDQEDTEWVMLVAGSATLTFESGDSLSLKVGDYVTLPPHCKHRVDWCSEEAIWLALHCH
ncbi:MAG: cupin domain-containing protein [Methylovulum sp.]|nr:cupin domain-containing protein [Methylovulum sp.]